MDSQRKIKTKNKMKQTFVELLHEKQFEKITIIELCNRADVNRSTFYEYFYSIYDILDSVANDYLKTLQNIIENRVKENLSAKEIMFNVLSYIKENKYLFKIFEKHSDLFFNYNTNLMDVYASQSLMKAIPHKDEHLEFRIEFLNQGLKGMLKNWISNDCEGDFSSLSDEISFLLHRMFDYY